MFVHLYWLIDGLSLFSLRIETIPASFSSLRRLEVLEASINRIAELPPQLFDEGGMVALRKVNLSFNRLSRLPETMGCLRALSSLNVTQNPLTALPYSLGSAEELRELFVDQELLSFLPPELKSQGQERQHRRHLQQRSRTNNVVEPRSRSEVMSSENSLSSATQMSRNAGDKGDESNAAWVTPMPTVEDLEASERGSSSYGTAEAAVKFLRRCKDSVETGVLSLSKLCLKSVSFKEQCKKLYRERRDVYSTVI